MHGDRLGARGSRRCCRTAHRVRVEVSVSRRRRRPYSRRGRARGCGGAQARSRREGPVGRRVKRDSDEAVSSSCRGLRRQRLLQGTPWAGCPGAPGRTRAPDRDRTAWRYRRGTRGMRGALRRPAHVVGLDGREVRHPGRVSTRRPCSEQRGSLPRGRGSGSGSITYRGRRHPRRGTGCSAPGRPPRRGSRGAGPPSGAVSAATRPPRRRRARRPPRGGWGPARRGRPYRRWRRRRPRARRASAGANGAWPGGGSAELSRRIVPRASGTRQGDGERPRFRPTWVGPKYRTPPVAGRGSRRCARELARRSDGGEPSACIAR